MHLGSILSYDQAHARPLDSRRCHEAYWGRSEDLHEAIYETRDDIIERMDHEQTEEQQQKVLRLAQLWYQRRMAGSRVPGYTALVRELKAEMPAWIEAAGSSPSPWVKTRCGWEKRA